MVINLLWLIICSGLVFLMQAGFMCLESGLTRTKNNINVAVKNIADFGLSVTLFWLIGYGFMFGHAGNGWLSWHQFAISPQNDPKIAVFFLFQAMFCGTATTIISGAVAERLNFKAYLLIAGLVSGGIYPLFGHWAWNGILEQNQGGWLEKLGFIDFAGSTVVHSVGAWVSLATLLIIGARTGRYGENDKDNKIQGSNLPFAVLGALLLWFGWIGFNGGSLLVFDERVPLIIMNTMLAGVGGMITAMVLSTGKLGYLSVEWLINGSIAGLVAITACCQMVSPPLAFIVGITGSGIMFLVEYQLNRWKIDDAVGAIAVHGGAGMWGTLCVALFGQLNLIDTQPTRFQQLAVQLLGIFVCFIWVFGISWLILTAINRFFPLRVSPEAEALGLNISEHQAKTDTYDLLEVMDWQMKTQDISRRVPVEPFTEIGHIATRYNQVMDTLEAKNRQSIDYLEQIYQVTAIASSCLENQNFDPSLFESFIQEKDELGNLALVLQRLIQQLQLNSSAQKDNNQVFLRHLFNEIFTQKFGDIETATQDKIGAIEDEIQLINILKEIALARDVEEFKKRLV